MLPAKLQRGTKYRLKIDPETDNSLIVTYNYETINYYFFESETATTYYLHYQQVIHNLTEL